MATENLQNLFFSKFSVFGKISPVKKRLLGYVSTSDVGELPKFRFTQFQFFLSVNFFFGISVFVWGKFL
jgi:hypothetical protein